jgi:hypothetical protein
MQSTNKLGRLFIEASRRWRAACATRRSRSAAARHLAWHDDTCVPYGGERAGVRGGAAPLGQGSGELLLTDYKSGVHPLPPCPSPPTLPCSLAAGPPRLSWSARKQLLFAALC